MKCLSALKCFLNTYWCHISGPSTQGGSRTGIPRSGFGKSGRGRRYQIHTRQCLDGGKEALENNWCHGGAFTYRSDGMMNRTGGIENGWKEQSLTKALWFHINLDFGLVCKNYWHFLERIWSDLICGLLVSVARYTITETDMSTSISAFCSYVYQSSFQCVCLLSTIFWICWNTLTLKDNDICFP